MQRVLKYPRSHRLLTWTRHAFGQSLHSPLRFGQYTELHPSHEPVSYVKMVVKIMNKKKENFHYITVIFSPEFPSP